ncbi:MAG: hypothetical protein WC136_01765 [Sphaerochaeta sp.]|jgi:hypothetical protein
MLPNVKFTFDIVNQSKKALKKLEESKRYVQPTIGADRYNEILLESKLNHDANFFMHLGSSATDSNKYLNDLHIFLESVADLYKEVDMKPRTCSVSVDTKELNENSVLDIYSKQFSERINKQFTKPLFEGTLIPKYNKESKLLMESAIVSEAINDIESESFLKYAIFENIMIDTIVSTVIPEALMERTDHYIGQQNDEYFELFTKNAKNLKETIYESAYNIASNISPTLFENGIGQELNTQNYAGISKALR